MRKYTAQIVENKYIELVEEIGDIALIFYGEEAIKEINKVLKEDLNKLNDIKPIIEGNNSVFNSKDNKVSIEFINNEKIFKFLKRKEKEKKK